MRAILSKSGTCVIGSNLLEDVSPLGYAAGMPILRSFPNLIHAQFPQHIPWSPFRYFVIAFRCNKALQ
jgi:hypothetical protein